jgi:hypothetical protein
MRQISVWWDGIAVPPCWRVSRDLIEDGGLLSTDYLYHYPAFATARVVGLATAAKEGIPAVYWPTQGQCVPLTEKETV